MKTKKLNKEPLIENEAQKLLENFCSFLAHVENNEQRLKLCKEITRLIIGQKENTRLYTHEECITIAKNMIAYGGGFVKHLGEALLRADEDNRIRMQEAFPNYLAEYLIFS